MAITKQQFEELGLQLVNGPSGTRVIGGAGQRTPYAKEADASTLQYLQGIGITPTQLTQQQVGNPNNNEFIWVDAQGNRPNVDWTTASADKFTLSNLDSAYAQFSSQKAQPVAQTPSPTVTPEVDHAGDPNWIPVKVGNGIAYIPKGSAAEANMQNIGTNNTSNLANMPSSPTISRVGNDFFYTNGAGQNVPMDEALFKNLGINETFVKDGASVPLQQAVTGRVGPADISGASPNIPTSSVSPANPVSLTGATGSTSSAASTVAGAIANANAILNAMAAEKTAAQNSEDKLTKEIDALIGENTGRGAAQASAEEAQQVNAIKKSIADVSAQLKSKVAEYNALSTQNEGRAVTMNSIIGSEAQIQKAKASEIGMLNATLLGLQGQATAAQDAADRAVELKYDDIEAKLNAKIQQLQLLQPKLTEEEKIRSQALTEYYNQQKQLVTDQKAQDKKFSDVKITALGNNMPLSLAQEAERLFNAGRVDEAYAKMSKYTGTVSGDNPTDDTKKIIQEFSKSLASWDLVGTREQFIRRLQANYPDIDPNSISDYVYHTYQDGYNK